MKIVKLESFLANCGLRNYLFVRLTTDNGLSGVGEATLEWQEATVQTLVHEWAEERILGVCPFDIEQVFGDLIRDQYQGGATVMTVISALRSPAGTLWARPAANRFTACWAGAHARACRLMPTAGTAAPRRRGTTRPRRARWWRAVTAA